MTMHAVADLGFDPRVFRLFEKNFGELKIVYALAII